MAWGGLLTAYPRIGSISDFQGQECLQVNRLRTRLRVRRQPYFDPDLMVMMEATKILISYIQ